MSVIIRLQNLPWSANALDIRGFFRGLSIPDGGVHIVGGEMGDAFIAFSTDEDARQAMMMNGGKIKEVSVSTFLSSRAQMQKVIETARQTSVNYMTLSQPVQPTPAVVTTPIQVAPIKQAQPQPPVISLSGFLSQNMSAEIPGLGSSSSSSLPVTQSQPSVDFLSSYQSQSTPAFQSNLTSRNVKNNFLSSNENSSDHDTYGGGSRSRRDRDRKNRSSSSRSRSRERRRRDRSRSRDSRRRRDRSRSRDRRRDRRDRRTKSRDRDRERDKNRSGGNDRRGSRDPRDAYQSDSSVKKEPITIWDIPLQTSTPQIPVVQPLHITPKLPEPVVANKYDVPLTPSPVQNISAYNRNFSDLQRGNLMVEANFNSGMFSRQMPQQQQQQQVQQQPTPQLNPQNSQLSPEQLSRIQELTSRRNPGAFQPDSNLGNNFSANNKQFQFGGNFNNNSRDNFNDNFHGDFGNQQRNQYNSNDDNGGGRMNRDDGNNMFVYDDDDDFGKPLQSSRGGNPVRNNDPTQGLCVKISNFEEKTGYSEIRRFFNGLVIGNNGIKMLNDNFGHRMGVAVVQFNRNDAKCKAVYRNGYELKGRKVVVEPITDEEFAEAVDSYRPGKRPNFNDDDFDRERTYRERSPIGGNQRDNSNNRNNMKKDNDVGNRFKREPSVECIGEEFSTVVLTDLPSLATEQDVMKIFSEYSLMQIIMLRTDDWKKQYQAFVKFHRAEDAKAALANKTSHYIGRREVFIAKCSEEDFETAKRKYSPDIPAFDNQNQFGNNNSQHQRPNGPNNNSNKNQRKNFTNNQRNFGNNFTPNRDEPNSNCVMMSNLNKSTTERDVLDFFSDIGIIPTKIHILRNKFKQPSGDCICEFPIVNDAVSAMAKNGGYFNQNQVTLNFISMNRVKEILSVDLLESEGEEENKQRQEQERLKKLQEENELKERQEKEKQLAEEKRLAEEKLKHEREAAEKIAEEKRLMEEKQKQEQAELEAKQKEQIETKETVIDEPKQDIDTRAIRQEYQPTQSNDMEITNNDSPKQDEDDRGFQFDDSQENTNCDFDDDNNRPFLNMPHMMMRQPSMGRNAPPSLQFENQRMMRDTFDVPGCVIALSNLPYRCNTFDLQEFFQPFNIFEHHIMRRYNDRGEPTGDARVCFPTPNDAARAMNMVRNKKMHNRKVFVRSFNPRACSF